MLVFTLIRVVYITGFKCKATPTNNTDYGYRKKAVELANQSCGVHITPHHPTRY